MRRKDKVKRKWWIIGAAVPILLAVVLVNMPPATECMSSPPVTEHQYWVRASKVVAQPWRGRHQVYGIFTISEQFKFDHLYKASLTIQGIDAEFKAGSPEDEESANVTTESGYYTKRVYLSTRTALWFLVTGRFGNVRTACHWWLVIASRAP